MHVSLFLDAEAKPVPAGAINLDATQGVTLYQAADDSVDVFCDSPEQADQVAAEFIMLAARLRSRANATAVAS